VRRPRDTLTGRLVLLGVLTALVSVLAVGVVGVGLVRSSAQSQAQQSLADEADLIARLLSRVTIDTDQLAAAVAELERRDVSAYVLGPADTVPETLPLDVLAQGVESGSAGGANADPPTFVEVRRLAPQQVLVLETPVGTAINTYAGPVLAQLAVALLVGLVVAVAAGALAARRLARPLRDTGEAARRMSTGQRSLRVEAEGPVEVAEVADALNSLADALELSENRQRRFLLSVSHELRTPLTAVRGYAEALSDGVVTGEDATRAGQVIAAEAGRLDALMSDLLALARSEADDFEVEVVPVDLVELVREAEQAWSEPARQAGLDLRAETAPTPVLALADPLRTRQVIDALVANAVRVTPPGRPVVLLADSVGSRARLGVRDGGPGLSDDDLPVAFDPGVLRDRYEGTRPGGSGIGLALVERLVRRMGGDVAAGHAPEGGASFTVALPGAPAPERSTAQGPPD
jgi:two-component system OmpR family sensor kinase